MTFKFRYKKDRVDEFEYDIINKHLQIIDAHNAKYHLELIMIDILDGFDFKIDNIDLCNNNRGDIIMAYLRLCYDNRYLSTQMTDEIEMLLKYHFWPFFNATKHNNYKSDFKIIDKNGNEIEYSNDYDYESGFQPTSTIIIEFLNHLRKYDDALYKYLLTKDEKLLEYLTKLDEDVNNNIIEFDSYDEFHTVFNIVKEVIDRFGWYY